VNHSAPERERCEVLWYRPEYLTDSDMVVVLKTVIIEISVNQKEAIS